MSDNQQYPPDWQHGAPTKPTVEDPHESPDKRVSLVRIQLISQAAGVWVYLHAAAYSAGVR